VTRSQRARAGEKEKVRGEKKGKRHPQENEGKTVLGNYQEAGENRGRLKSRKRGGHSDAEKANASTVLRPTRKPCKQDLTNIGKTA